MILVNLGQLVHSHANIVALIFRVQLLAAP